MCERREKMIERRDFPDEREKKSENEKVNGDN
jgi:hypothetical protein